MACSALQGWPDSHSSCLSLFAYTAVSCLFPRGTSARLESLPSPLITSQIKETVSVSFLGRASTGNIQVNFEQMLKIETGLLSKRSHIECSYTWHLFFFKRRHHSLNISLIILCDVCERNRKLF